MARNFSVQRGPDWHHGEESDPILTPVTQTDQSRIKRVDVLPGETLADLTKRIYGTNSDVNRQRIEALNRNVNGKVRVIRVR